MNSYLLFKSLHLIAVIFWMAGLLYLPRIFVYHVENKKKKEATDIFEAMEKRLYFYIMRPAMIFTWIFGLILIYLNGIEIFSQLWLQSKLVLVILLSIYHEYLGKCLYSLKNGTNTSGNLKVLNNANAVYAVGAVIELPAKEKDPNEHTAMKIGVENNATPKRALIFCALHTKFTSSSRIFSVFPLNVFSQA